MVSARERSKAAVCGSSTRRPPRAAYRPPEVLPLGPGSQPTGQDQCDRRLVGALLVEPPGDLTGLSGEPTTATEIVLRSRAEVAAYFGFTSPAYFTRAFQHRTGKTPTAFRRGG